MNLTVCPPFGTGSIPSFGVVFRGIFPWLIGGHTLPTRPEPASQKIPQGHHVTCRHQGGRPKSRSGRTAEVKMV